MVLKDIKIILFRDVVTVLTLEGPNYNGPLSLKKRGGGRGAKYILKKSPKIGRPGPLGDYTPAFECKNLLHYIYLIIKLHQRDHTIVILNRFIRATQ